MKFILLVCLVASVAAAPQHSEKDATIIVDEREDLGDGNFNYRYETSNKIYESRTGTPGVAGQSNMDGVISFVFPDGTPAELSFVANDHGFQPSSNLLPTPHPFPDFVYEQLRVAEEQRSRG
ncbi:cuticle protein AM1159-like isoform X1 [Panulirus ornatus]|uniref:cuticle protein AM1159-like isoform X1 n=1 Tax=Panulirus ornatus TaxID=150431 RepID=UPI003A8BD73D